MLVAHAADVSVAVASNFAQPMRDIAAAFRQKTGHQAIVAPGSTGKFYAQISNGAPYDIFLAADRKTPADLEHQGKGVPGSRFTYAQGRLVLWSRRPNEINDGVRLLRAGNFTKLALADPRHAPYGVAAVQTLNRLGLEDITAAKLVFGENVSQALHFVASGNAELGFVALSQVYAKGQINRGSAWIVPQALYEPIRQDVLLLKPGQNNPAALALMGFLRGAEARAIMKSFGYSN